jgi:hypothetical protein
MDLGRGLSGEVLRSLDRDAPEAVVVPSGRAIRLEYAEDGSVSASVKLQELFGLAETPRVGPRGEDRLRASRAERPACSADSRPAQLLEPDLSRDPQGVARPLSKTPVARRSLERDANAAAQTP